LCSSLYFFFFFSSRRRHTRFDCDWSSDVCSSDLDVARADPQPLRMVQLRERGVHRLPVEERLPHAHEHDVRRLALRVLQDHLARSEEHTSELQSQSNLVCRLLLEKKKKTHITWTH